MPASLSLRIRRSTSRSQLAAAQFGSLFPTAAQAFQLNNPTGCLSRTFEARRPLAVAKMVLAWDCRLSNPSSRLTTDRWASRTVSVAVPDSGFLCQQLTARDEEEDILRGLQIGADDYMTKPFSAKQLAARMKAVMRRCQTDPYRQPASEVRVADLVLDLQSHEVTKAGKPVQLTRLEFRILYMLALNEGRIIPYSRLIEYAWGYYDEGNSNLLKTHI